MKRLNQSAVTLTPPPPPPPPPPPLSLLDLPSHLVEDILFRVPVKSLLHLRCTCKQLNSQLNSLISDPKFPQNHLRFSTNRFHLHMSSINRIASYPIHSIFSTIDLIPTASTYFECPPIECNINTPYIVGSCDGLLCIAIPFFTTIYSEVIVVCNPYIRKFNQLSLPLEEENPQAANKAAYGFGYDPLSHNYKFLVVKRKTQVKIHTLGTHSWRSIGNFPFGFPDHLDGVSLSGTVNWLVSNRKLRTYPVIVSLDLRTERFQQLPQPNYGRRIIPLPPHGFSLSVQRDCLCLLADHNIWMMKEFGNQNSWTKFITIPYLQHPSTFSGYPSTSYGFRKLLYISEDDKFVLDAYGLPGNLIVYDSRNGLVKYLTMMKPPHLLIESLISPSPEIK